MAKVDYGRVQGLMQTFNIFALVNNPDMVPCRRTTKPVTYVLNTRMKHEALRKQLPQHTLTPVQLSHNVSHGKPNVDITWPTSNCQRRGMAVVENDGLPSRLTMQMINFVVSGIRLFH